MHRAIHICKNDRPHDNTLSPPVTMSVNPTTVLEYAAGEIAKVLLETYVFIKHLNQMEPYLIKCISRQSYTVGMHK